VLLHSNIILYCMACNTINVLNNLGVWWASCNLVIFCLILINFNLTLITGDIRSNFFVMGVMLRTDYKVLYNILSGFGVSFSSVSHSVVC
jgi:hypothetical protein